jgi:hypothetical protein
MVVKDNLTGDDNAKFQKGLDFPYLELIDEKISDVAGGTFTKTEWRTRDFTTTIHNDFATSITLAVSAGDGAQFVIPAGVYHIEASAPAFKVGMHTARLADVTDGPGAHGATLFEGTMESSANATLWRDSIPAAMTIATASQTRSQIEGRFTVARSTTLEIQHIGANTQSTDGFGSAGRFYDPFTDNIYSVLKMWQVSEGGTGPDRAHNAHQQTFIKQTMSLENWVAKGQLAQVTTAPLGFVDNWSVAIWAKNVESSGDSSTDSMFAWKGDILGSKDALEMRTGFNTTQHMNVSVTDASQAERQFHVYNDVIAGGPSADWHHFVLTWDGTVGGMKLYVDAVETAPTSSSSDLDSSTITDTDRNISVGSRGGAAGDQWRGPIYSAGVYNVVVGQAAVTAMYNGGNAKDFDLETNSGDYQVADNLQDYYRVGLGTTVADFGKDHGTDATDRVLTNSSDSDDLTSDIPV